MNVIEAAGVGRRYGRRWALRNCTLDVPAGRIVGLVGANGAGKTSLLHLIAGLQRPTEGSMAVFGRQPGTTTEDLARIGFVAQAAPLYPQLTVAEHLHLGRALNPAWNDRLATGRIARLGLDRAQRAGRLSGGERAQLALTLAVSKQPAVLLLDEPVASLDPLARRSFLQDLMEFSATDQPTVVLSSHVLADVERVCDRLIVLDAGEVRLAGDVEELLAAHKLLTGARHRPTPPHVEVVEARHTPRQSTLLVRTTQPVADPQWIPTDIGLEDLVLAYMHRESSRPDAGRSRLQAVAP